MADYPADSFHPGHTVLGPQTLISPECRLHAISQTSAIGWPTANQARFVPVLVTSPITIAKMFVVNGGTVSGNIDVGIYDSQGTRLVNKGSTAQAGTSAIQTFDITDTLLNPGLYYLACAMDNTTGQINMWQPGSFMEARSMGVLAMSTAFALPATATFAALATGRIPSVYATSQTVI